MNIPVDGVIIRSSGVQANEAAMTGESDELKKDSFENKSLDYVTKVSPDYNYNGFKPKNISGLLAKQVI